MFAGRRPSHARGPGNRYVLLTQEKLLGINFHLGNSGPRTRGERAREAQNRYGRSREVSHGCSRIRGESVPARPQSARRTATPITPASGRSPRPRATSTPSIPAPASFWARWWTARSPTPRQPSPRPRPRSATGGACRCSSAPRCCARSPTCCARTATSLRSSTPPIAATPTPR